MTEICTCLAKAIADGRGGQSFSENWLRVRNLLVVWIELSFEVWLSDFASMNVKFTYSVSLFKYIWIISFILQTCMLVTCEKQVVPDNNNLYPLQCQAAWQAMNLWVRIYQYPYNRDSEHFHIGEIPTIFLIQQRYWNFVRTLSSLID